MLKLGEIVGVIMTIEQTITYDTAGDLDYDTSIVETVGGKTQLKLTFTAISDFSEDFTDDTGFTYDNTKAEFTGGVIQGKNQTPSNSIMAGKFASKDLTWRNDAGSNTGTLVGSPTFNSGKMQAVGANGVYWQRTTSASESHKFLYTPNYSTTPSANVNIISIYNGTNNNDRLDITHSPSGTGTIRLTLYNSSGSTVVSAATTIGTWNPTSGQEYEIELVVDSSTGVVRFFVDGVLNSSSSPGAWTRGSISSRVYLGASTSIYTNANASYDNYILFDNVQHSSGYTPGYSIVDFRFAETIATLPTFTYSGPGNVAPAGAPTSTESGSPRYIVQGKYWNGSEWVDSSDTYATASSKSDIVSNIDTFPDTGSSDIIVDVAFPDSNTNSSVDQIDFSVQGELYSQTNPTVTTNSHTQLDAITSFSAIDSASGSDEVRYLLATYTVVGGTPTYRWWNGTAWAISNGTFAESNTADEINSNIANLDISAGFYARFFAFLSSDDGTTTPSITSITFSYSFFTSPSTPNKCVVYGWLREVDNSPITGTVTIQNPTAFHHSGLLIPKSNIEVSTNVDGYWEASVIETATISRTYDVIIRYTDPVATTVRQTVTIPNQDSASFESLL